MIVVLIISLLVAGWIIVRNRQHVPTLFYLAPFRKRSDFLALYDLHDSQSDYEELSDHDTKLKSYAAFLRLHQLDRAKAYIAFKKYWDAIRQTVTREYLLLFVLLIPTYLYGVISTYVVAALTVQGLCIAIELLKKHDRGYYIGAIICLVHTTISKAKS